ncbi:YciI family protein [Streptomyces sp. NPDC048172]|uniref:YciI family protein n=1 Tax=Streptomyces sp. NPDC048172 TaxID=3365505 RepID=UPI0037160311
MKYMLMVMGNQAEYDAMEGKGDGSVVWTEDAMKAMFEHMGALNNDLAESGELVDAQGLTAPAQGKAVSVKDGRTVVSDGPFVEAKEVLAGYWIVDVASEERAIEIAARAYSCPIPEGAPALPLVVQPIQDAGAPEM